VGGTTAFGSWRDANRLPRFHRPVLLAEERRALGILLTSLNPARRLSNRADHSNGGFANAAVHLPGFQANALGGYLLRKHLPVKSSLRRLAGLSLRPVELLAADGHSPAQLLGATTAHRIF